MEPTEEQYLILNALETLNLIEYDFYDSENGDWYIATPDAILPISIVLPNGEIIPTRWRE